MFMYHVARRDNSVHNSVRRHKIDMNRLVGLHVPIYDTNDGIKKSKYQYAS